MRKFALYISVQLILSLSVSAQTDVDGDMMAKKLLCVGPTYTYSSWSQYWEGTLKRNNLNLGTVSANTYSLMGNYGITSRLNFLFNVPYVTTNASAGTMHGMKGLQDVSLFLKWRPVYKKTGQGRLSLIGVAGYTTPLTNYMADYLPLSLGLHSNNLSGRVLADYQYKKWFITGSFAYIYRSNITIDRNSYYTTEMHLTNEVQMPDVANYNVRAGFRSNNVVAEAVLNRMTTLGGFDISRNNMPFPSNRMNATSVQANIRYIVPGLSDLNLNVGASYTVGGRNVGQTTAYYGGAFYIFHFSGKAKINYQFQN